jgi:hypothetical protein
MKKYIILLPIILSMLLGGGYTLALAESCCLKNPCICAKGTCCEDGKCACKGDCCVKGSCQCAEGKCGAKCNCQKQ